MSHNLAISRRNLALAMRAVPGSGKSTLAGQLIAHSKACGKTTAICSADEYFYSILGTGYDARKLTDAMRHCYRKFVESVNDCVNVIILDNTNLSAWEISPYRSYADMKEYDFRIVDIVADPEVAFGRKLHAVPERLFANQLRRFEREFMPRGWERYRFLSKTDSSGNPIFEEIELPNLRT
jgi:hypothetical protein